MGAVEDPFGGGMENMRQLGSMMNIRVEAEAASWPSKEQAPWDSTNFEGMCQTTQVH